MILISYGRARNAEFTEHEILLLHKQVLLGSSLDEKKMKIENPAGEEIWWNYELENFISEIRRFYYDKFYFRSKEIIQFLKKNILDFSSQCKLFSSFKSRCLLEVFG